MRTYNHHTYVHVGLSKLSCEMFHKHGRRKQGAWGAGASPSPKRRTREAKPPRNTTLAQAHGAERY